jgi:hypothetical protein
VELFSKRDIKAGLTFDFQTGVCAEIFVWEMKKNKIPKMEI